jgi:glycosyltransferase involved in cell wall biosynthesis
MRVGIGAILGTLGGPATYARELVRALAHIDSCNEYVVITDAPQLLGVTVPNLRCVAAPLRTPLLQPVWDHVLVPYLIRRHRLDLYHGTKGMLPLWGRCPEVVTVHDLAVYHQPESFAWLQRVHQRSHTPFAVRRAVRVITDSEYERQDVVAHFQLPSERVVAIPLGVGPQFSAQPGADDERVAAAWRLPARYVLYVGTVQPRKNVAALVTAFAELADPGGLELLIVGRVRPTYRPTFVRRPPRGVRYLGPVADSALAVLYRRALALCSPSSYEGFGLSVLEAMASGCLVIAGRNSAVPELVSDCGILLESLRPAVIGAALERVVADGESLAGMRARARVRAARYTWEETARRTLAVYRGVAGDVRAGA